MGGKTNDCINFILINCITLLLNYFHVPRFQLGQGHFVTSHLGDNMASVTWATQGSTKWVDQIDQLTDIFEEVSVFVVWLGRFAPFAK